MWGSTALSTFEAAVLSIGSGIYIDIKNRSKFYASDWRDIGKSKLR